MPTHLSKIFQISSLAKRTPGMRTFAATTAELTAMLLIISTVEIIIHVNLPAHKPMPFVVFEVSIKIFLQNFFFIVVHGIRY